MFSGASHPRFPPLTRSKTRLACQDALHSKTRIRFVEGIRTNPIPSADFAEQRGLEDLAKAAAHPTLSNNLLNLCNLRAI